jgi:hypothetical protein
VHHLEPEEEFPTSSSGLPPREPKRAPPRVAAAVTIGRRRHTTPIDIQPLEIWDDADTGSASRRREDALQSEAVESSFTPPDTILLFTGRCAGHTCHVHAHGTPPPQPCVYAAVASNAVSWDLCACTAAEAVAQFQVTRDRWEAATCQGCPHRRLLSARRAPRDGGRVRGVSRSSPLHQGRSTRRRVQCVTAVAGPTLAVGFWAR